MRATSEAGSHKTGLLEQVARMFDILLYFGGKGILQRENCAGTSCATVKGKRMDREKDQTPSEHTEQPATNEEASEDELSAGEEGASEEVRPLKSWYRWSLRIVAIAMTLFQLYTAWFGAYIASTQRATHVAFALVIAFLLFKTFGQNRANKNAMV